MKYLAKITIVILLITTFFACNEDEQILQKDLTNSSWKVKALDNDNNKILNEISIFFQFDGDNLTVFIQPDENSKPILTEKYPALHKGNEIVLYNPFQKKEIISTIKLDVNNNFIGKNVEYQVNNFSEVLSKNTTANKTHPIICSACYGACYYVHGKLGISDLNGICCFYLDC